ncbi:hypothetical protein AVEN_269518-1 [Araneus ventricosus]|uniref:Retrovirus-related Pol polyprotein from type-1 retrotransposable element R2 n=1 Tax=Araneus ventricosus TaxID=182803 RepID=A0A4Y1ZRZ3_ARAVE|nr:hypothetical protein AVEN_269518-1 [Araneus ventricosus]
MTIDTECEHKCQHPDCSFSSPTVLGLRNHTAAHSKSDALAAAVQRKIPNSIKTNKRTKKLKKQARDIPDEAISDPSVSLAAPHVPPGDVPAPPTAPPQPVPGPLSIYIQALEAILQQDPSDEVFVHFCETVEQAVSEVQKISLPDDFGNPTPQEPRKQRKPVSVKDTQSAQLLYRRNPKRAVREICEGEPIRCQIPTETIEDFFTQAWNSHQQSIPPLEVNSDDRSSPVDRPFTIAEISKKLSTADNTAAGPDRLTYFHWRSVPQSPKFLTLTFNCCLHLQRIPPSWKISTTVLIPKSKTNLDDPTNWRPIALSSTIYKLYTKALTGRLSNWCEKYRVLSPSQKGFTPFDGVLEHNFILQTRLEQARMKRIQGPASEHRVLAFADDLCLLASSPEELQDLLDLVHCEMGKIGLSLNPRKSYSFYLSGVTPVGVRDHVFQLGSDSLHPIEESQYHKFLGKPVGFNPVPDYQKFND